MRLLIIFLLSAAISVAAQEKAVPMNELRSTKIREVFNQLRANNTEILNGFYASDVVFIDPLGQINGLSAMKEYYQAMYKNVDEIRFEFKPDAITGDRHLAVWTMYLRAKGLNGGDEVAVHGVSEIEFQAQSNLVIYHRDYFDMGEFLYQHIPILGSVIKMVRKQLEHKPSGE